MRSNRVLRVAGLLSAETAAVTRETAALPGRISAVLAELPSGTLLTLELQRGWWDRRRRRLVLSRLNRSLRAIARATERVTVVAAALLADGAVLVAQRNHPPALDGQWEFPGGKVERGESPRAALVRECAEELGCQVTVGAELARQDLDTGAVLVLFQVALAATSPQPRLIEHRALSWARAPELAALDWVPTNRRFVTDVTGRL
ncbi:MAG: NUDIX domain-containing protein [Actinomycetota bacterium]|nr:NUDIX domain-containing protein [Actinomycetota bacterium]